MGSISAAFIHSPRLDELSYPPDCPFRTQRAGMVREILLPMGLLSGSRRREVRPEPATEEEVLAFHTAEYLDILRRAEKGDMDFRGLEAGLGTPETPVFVGMVEYAFLAAGASLTGAQLLLDDEADVAFNPSGGYHHAFPAKASGFCYINDVVLACQKLLRAGKRVLFLDIDVHHGDGVQSAFYDSTEVMTLSLHESGRTLFPGTGAVEETGIGEGRGYSVNVPLPADTYDEAYVRAFNELVPPLAEAYDPDVIVLEVGMDCLSGDPLAHMNLTNNAYADVVEVVGGFGRPLLTLGGGGYHPENTARGWALVWSILCGEGDRRDESFGLGGVMLESTDWQAGLRDRTVVTPQADRRRVNREVASVVKAVQETVFPIHGISP